MFLIFDTETTGLPRNYNAPVSDSDNWPRLVQIAWQLHDTSGKLISNQNYIVKPEGFDIPYQAAQVHGITTERALKDGYDLDFVLKEFTKDLNKTSYVVGHNIEFDIKIMGAEFYRRQVPTELESIKALDTKEEATDFCAISGGKGGKFKWPTLTELHQKLFGVGFDDAHDAAYDVDATAKCFFGLLTHRVITPTEIEDASVIHYEAPELEEANFAAQTQEQASTTLKTSGTISSELADAPFVHLHCHSRFSILQSTSDLQSIIGKAKELEMPAVSMTDHDNMMGAFLFVQEAIKQGIKPIIGAELRVCKDHKDKSYKDDGFQTVLLAKNKNGYHNLAKLASKAYTEGFYYFPRISKSLLLEYKEDLIITTGGLWGEVPYLILNVGVTQAEEAFIWYKEHFGENFYAEINRHGLPEEDVVNDALLKFCEKHHVKYIAANNTYYTDKTDAETHDILLCVKDAESVNKPKKYIGKRGREFRFGFPNEEFYIKSPNEIKKLFADIPDAIFNIAELVEGIEQYELARDVILPKFEIPEEFIDPRDDTDGGKRGEVNYLRHITYEGAKKRYQEVTEDIKERLDFELATIEKTGYPGYFLIVEDFIREARNMGVWVGPGRGSAAGSVVAYCIGITNVDPIAYDLLFERFLNPDRTSMPDIDIDFDDEGRQKVIDYVIDKYGSNQVAQIITYGTMAAKSSIRDAGRVMDLSLPDTDRVAKLVPGISLKKLFSLDEKALKDKLKNNGDEIEKANQLKEVAESNAPEAKVVQQATILEGSVRNTGVHACGVIITPDDITNFVPVATPKDSDMCCTQFDNSVVESAGLLKMDFLGLKTLTLLRDSIAIVKERHGIDIDPDKIPLDDEKTYALFQRGDTVGIFQYESPGMQKHLKALKPTAFEDLIAMNALYRPGPMEYIPSFCRRKHGEEEIKYDLDACEEILKETYGITVYQEQVMLLSQKLAEFTKGQADSLRKAMGKKKRAIIDEMKPLFIEGGTKNGHDEKILDKIWTDWEAFASYAFNKSHSTCYAWIAFQTAYMKANYPAEYMAAVLSNNMNDIKSVTFFMEECKSMGIPVLGPDVNESAYHFTVNTEGAIRFGIGAIKGVGKGAVNAIVQEREENGAFKDVYDFFKRLPYSHANKKTMESLILGGGLDGFTNIHRAMLLHDAGGTFLETLMKHGQACQQAKDAPPDLFGGISQIEIADPPMPGIQKWDRMEELRMEKEVIGIFLSGHPLDDYKYEVQKLCKPVDNLSNLDDLGFGDFMVGGVISANIERIDKNGNPYGRFTLEDYSGSHEFFLFRDDYTKFRGEIIQGSFVYIKAAVTKRKWKENEKEVRIQQIGALSELLEKEVNRISISLNLNTINDPFVKDLKTLLNGEQGQCALEMKILDETEKGMEVKMRSRSLRVKINSEKLQKLEKMEEVSLSLS